MAWARAGVWLGIIVLILSKSLLLSVGESLSSSCIVTEASVGVSTGGMSEAIGESVDALVGMRVSRVSISSRISLIFNDRVGSCVFGDVMGRSGGGKSAAIGGSVGMPVCV